MRNNRYDIEAIWDEREKADRVIYLHSMKKFDLGLGKVKNRGRSPIYLSMEEIYNFLESEKHKNFVVLVFGKSIMWSKSSKELASKCLKKFRELGYDRILILGAHGMGVHVLKDEKLHHVRIGVKP